MPVKVLMNSPNDAIIEIDMDNLPSKFVRFHSHEGHIYMKDIGVVATYELEKRKDEAENRKSGFIKWKERLNE